MSDIVHGATLIVEFLIAVWAAVTIGLVTSLVVGAGRSYLRSRGPAKSDHSLVPSRPSEPSEPSGVSEVGELDFT